jgi:hypothetical protein
VTCCPHGHCWQIGQQIDEVAQRVRTGSCKQCEFKLCPRCSTSVPPVPSPCGDQCGSESGCPTCGNPQYVPQSPPSAANDRTAVPSTQTGWYGNLYSETGR